MGNNPNDRPSPPPLFPSVPEGASQKEFGLFLFCGRLVIEKVGKLRYGSLCDALSPDFIALTKLHFPDFYKEYTDNLRRPRRWDSEPDEENPQPSDVPSELALQFLTSLAPRTFPFLSYISTAQPIPPFASVIISMLSVKYLYEGETQPLDCLRVVLRALDSSPPKWAYLGNDLIGYCSMPESLLTFTPKPDKFSCALDGAVSLSPIGMEKLFQLKPAAQIREERMNGDRMSRRIHRILGNGRKCRNWEPEVIDIQIPRTSLDYLILPKELKQELELVVKLCQREPSSNPVLLFQGAPGTGKTYAASALAGSLKRTLGVVSLPKVLSKWSGETEKFLEQSFREAEKANCVLLLDECDSLLYSRVYSRQSWQVTQVNTLLKLLENPAIPIILVTNFIEKLDEAVQRRIHHLISFPVPGFEERKTIWKKEMASVSLRAPSVEIEKVAAIVLTGGLISNAVRSIKNRKKLLDKKFKLDTESFISAANRELPKMGTLSTHRSIGFTFPEREKASPCPTSTPISSNSKRISTTKHTGHID